MEEANLKISILSERKAAPPLSHQQLTPHTYSHDFQRAAAISAPPKAYAFYSTADTDCWTRDANESMLKRIFFRPRVMRDVSSVDLSSSILGISTSMPLFICPTGVARLINPDAEKALARAAKSTGITEIISTNSGHPLDEVVTEAPGHPFFFQLYLNKDRSKSRDLLKKVESLGLKAIFLTVDAAGRGKREADERLKSDDTIVDPVTGKPVKATGGLTRVMGSYIDQSMTWEAIAWIRSVTNLPIILKGITSAEDAKLALKYKVDGIVVSNHGGRNLDYSPPAILVLLELHKNCPEAFDKMEVYIDGGFRRGSDILKALCLGAKAVGIGRSFLFALHYGTEGVEHLVQLLRGEMESAMKLLGIKDLSEVHPGLVNTSDVDYLVPSGANHPYIKWRSRPHL
ncbi:FMN-dependent dehydrogenase [Aspergillus pseudoustus]|uniref:FMN-dependent dehydrogenase n=1 Tax=Aspergillus pseudoustus TaxID=1810923 RepID=A0ABR4IIA3_9EURO